MAPATMIVIAITLLTTLPIMTPVLLETTCEDANVPDVIYHVSC